jgi:hypothetical protein
VLRLLSDELRKAEVKWVLGGSLSLALQGVEVKPADIDVLTDKEGAFKASAILKKYEERKVEYSQTEKFASYFGVFKINDVKVEIMGDYKEKEEDRWVSLSHRLEKPRIVQIDDFEVLVSPLDDQLTSYQRSKRPKDIKKVEKIRRSRGRSS